MCVLNVYTMLLISVRSCRDVSSPGHKIMQALKGVQVDVEEMRRQEKLLDPPDGKRNVHIVTNGVLLRRCM